MLFRCVSQRPWVAPSHSCGACPSTPHLNLGCGPALHWLSTLPVGNHAPVLHIRLAPVSPVVVRNLERRAGIEPASQGLEGLRPAIGPSPRISQIRGSFRALGDMHLAGLDGLFNQGAAIRVGHGFEMARIPAPLNPLGDGRLHLVEVLPLSITRLGALPSMNPTATIIDLTGPRVIAVHGRKAVMGRQFGCGGRI